MPHVAPSQHWETEIVLLTILLSNPGSRLMPQQPPSRLEAETIVLFAIVLIELDPR